MIDNKSAYVRFYDPEFYNLYKFHILVCLQNLDHRDLSK